MRVAQAVSVYDPGGLQVPPGDRGRPSFRLEEMAPANGYHPGRSHEALADVRATLYLARRMRARAPGTLRRPEKSHRPWYRFGGKHRARQKRS